MLDLVREETSIPVPTVHRVIKIDGNDSNYGAECLFVMDFIEGSTVEEIWDTASDAQREDVTSQVATMLKALESVDAPKDQAQLETTHLYG